MNAKLLMLLGVFISKNTHAAPLIVIPGEVGSIGIEMDISMNGTVKRFHLDTGSNKTKVVLDEQTLSFPTEGKANPSGASGVSIECDLIRPQKISFASVVIENLLIQRCDTGPHSFNNLGLDILEGLILDLNFELKTIKALLNKPTTQIYQPITRLEKGHIKIPIQIQNDHLHGLYDTGAQLTAVDSAYLEVHPQNFKLLPEQPTGIDINGHPVPMKIYEISNLKIGSLDLTGVTALSFDFGKLRDYVGLDTPIILGTNIITRGNWILDLRTNHWSVTPIK